MTRLMGEMHMLYGTGDLESRVKAYLLRNPHSRSGQVAEALGANSMAVRKVICQLKKSGVIVKSGEASWHTVTTQKASTYAVASDTPWHQFCFRKSA